MDSLKKKKDPSICVYKIKRHREVKIERMEKIFQANSNEKRAVVLLLPYKVDFKSKIVPRDRRGHFMLEKNNS
jgi:hypothetical protein